LWKDVRFEIKRGERIGIIGPNGSGKTTMLRALMGQAEADSGTIRWGANLGIGYYDQRLDDFDPEASILEETRGERVGIKDQEIRDTLGTMLFTGDDVHKAMGTLSGGERARVALAEILLDKPNVLLLDEPTNHLDINSREALENALAGFGGTIICVSHDRYFLDKTVGRLLIINPPAVTDFPHGYSAYLQKISGKTEQQKSVPARDKPPREKSKPEARPQKAPAKSTGNPYSRKFGRLTVEQLEAEIASTESAVAELQRKFADTDAFRDAAKSKRLQGDYDQASQKLADLEEEYFARGNSRE
jgi:ATP-binding cassette subfamily F protein 3